MRDKSDGHFFVEERVSNFFVFSAMPGGEDGFLAGVGKKNSPVLLKFEIRGAKLLAVNERQRQPVGEPRTKLFHHIQSQ